MNPVQNQKVVTVSLGSTIHDNVALTTTEVDSLGFDYAQFYLYIGVTDVAFTVLNISEGTTAAGASTGTIIPDTNFASTAGITAIDGSTLILPSATQDTTWRRIDVDLKDKERYLSMNMTVGDATGAYIHALCLLSRAGQPPITEAGQGCVQIARE